MIDKDYLQRHIEGAIYGQIIGDAVGLPFELYSRAKMQENPCTDMTGGGAHQKPLGWWSDDGSLTLALVSSLTNVLVYPNKENQLIHHIADNIVNWYDNGAFTPGGYSFGSGGTTRDAIARYKLRKNPFIVGGLLDANNGNGSIMRILPLVFYSEYKNKELHPHCSIDETYKRTLHVSGITHAHCTSVLCCFYLIRFAENLLKGMSPKQSYHHLRLDFIHSMNEQSYIRAFLKNIDYNLDCFEPLSRLLFTNIAEYPDYKIKSGIFVCDTLEASIWCLLTTHSYKEAVLKAVNLGGDTDTTAAVTGGLAGLYYGLDNIPIQWIDNVPLQQENKNMIKLFSSLISSRIK